MVNLVECFVAATSSHNSKKSAYCAMLNWNCRVKHFRNVFDKPDASVACHSGIYDCLSAMKREGMDIKVLLNNKKVFNEINDKETAIHDFIRDQFSNQYLRFVYQPENEVLDMLDNAAKELIE